MTIRVPFEMLFMPLVSEFYPLSPYETIVSCLKNKFWERFLEVTLIYEPQHGDASVYGTVLVSISPTTIHAGFWATTC